MKRTETENGAPMTNPKPDREGGNQPQKEAMTTAPERCNETGHSATGASSAVGEQAGLASQQECGIDLGTQYGIRCNLERDHDGSHAHIDAVPIDAAAQLGQGVEGRKSVWQLFKHKADCLWATELPTSNGNYFGCTCGLDKLLLELEEFDFAAHPCAGSGTVGAEQWLIANGYKELGQVIHYEHAGHIGYKYLHEILDAYAAHVTKGLQAAGSGERECWMCETEGSPIQRPDNGKWIHCHGNCGARDCLNPLAFVSRELSQARERVTQLEGLCAQWQAEEERLRADRDGQTERAEAAESRVDELEQADIQRVKDISRLIEQRDAAESSLAALKGQNGNRCDRCQKEIGPLCEHVLWYDENGKEHKRHLFDCSAPAENGERP